MEDTQQDDNSTSVETVAQPVEPIETPPAADTVEPEVVREEKSVSTAQAQAATPLPDSAQEAPAMPETYTETSPSPLPATSSGQALGKEGTESEPTLSVETVEATPTSPKAVEPTITPPPSVVEVEKIVERVREPSDQEKEQIFRDKLKALSPRGVSARRAKRQANLDKILSYLRQHGYITNDEVEELCNVKDSAARKYLAELEGQHKLVQLGTVGRKVRYRFKDAITL